MFFFFKVLLLFWFLFLSIFLCYNVTICKAPTYVLGVFIILSSLSLFSIERTKILFHNNVRSMGTSVIAFLEAYLITGTPLTLWILIMKVIDGNWSIKDE